MINLEETIKSQFKSICKIDDDEINMNANLFDVYGLDSMKAIKLISDIEVEYDIDIPDEEAQNIRTLNDVVSIIKEKI